MVNPDLPKIAAAMDAVCEKMLIYQVTDKERPDYGGYFDDTYGFASPSHIGNAHFIQIAGCCCFCPESAYYDNAAVLERLMLAVAYQKKCQRPSGFIDIPFTNFDSPSDTGFAISILAMAAYMAQQAGTEAGKRFDAAIKPYLLSSADAVAGGGFHTPNHRWVIASAMAQVMELYPEADYTEAIEAYLKEGIDINPDGFYSERSTGGYNAVVNRQLTYLAEAMCHPDIHDAVKANLDCMMRLVNSDWSVVTSVSLRQDKGTRITPAKGVDSFYYTAMRTGDPVLSRAAQKLLELCGYRNDYLLYLFARHPEWRDCTLPQGQDFEDYTAYMADSGIYRIRRGPLSVTVVNGLSGVLSLSYGKADLSELRLFSPYFAGAKFKGTHMQPIDGGVRVTLQSEFLLPQLPGYWLPTGKPVDFNRLPFGNLDDRTVNKRPEFIFYLDIVECPGGLDLHIRTDGGMECVPFLAEFLFVPGGQVETEDVSFTAVPDQTLLLKSGYMTYSAGGDAITIGPGCHAHRSNYNGLEGTDGLFRVVLSDWSPVDRSVSIRVGKWSECEGQCLSSKGPCRASTLPS